MKNIWVLFSVASLYDQPSNNLEAWWAEKPSFDVLSKALGWGSFPCATDDATLYVVNLWQGADKQDRPGGTSYRLEFLGEGKVA